MYHPKSSSHPLNYQGVYMCPVCRHGEIAGITMMDAFGCNFCSSIFTANLEQQFLEKADSQPPLRWYWNGKNWQGGHRPGIVLGWGYWLAAFAFVMFPPSLVGLAAYIFPPVPGTLLSWLPVVWTVLTFLTHLSCLLWLMLEYYQFPFLTYVRAVQQRLLSRLNYQ